jgi:hypothetical protein
MKSLMTFVEWLRIAPPGTQLEAAALLDMLSPLATDAAKPSPPPAPGLNPTIQQVADELGRSPSTVRGWRLAGEFPNAYLLQGREWRIPRSDLVAFLDRQRPTAYVEPPTPARRRTEKPDLSSWRQHMKPGR